jgi:hypothetical protein
MRTIAALGVASVLSSYLEAHVQAENFFSIVKFISYAGMGFLTVWLLVSVAINWARSLDVFLTYGFRTSTQWKAITGCITLAALLLPMAGFAGAVLPKFTYAGLLLVAAPAIWYYARRGLQNIRLDCRYAEGSFRVVLSVAIIGVFLLFALK